MLEDMKQKMMGMLELHISNVHYRYEDQVTQELPFVCGFKVGYIGVTCKVESSKLRTSGDWRWNTGEAFADIFFCQAIQMRRISAYWDIDTPTERFFSTAPIRGREVFKRFLGLNRKETMRVAVVEKLLEVFPESHPKR